MQKLASLPDWEAREAELGRAVELLSEIPTWVEGGQEIHDLVGSMVEHAYGPNGSGRKRDRETFEQDFEQEASN